MWRQWLPLAGLALSLGACDPYTRFKGQSSAGALDPANFPAAYLGLNNRGAPASGSMPGSGTLLAASATVDGTTLTGYYNFPFTGTDLTVNVPDGTDTGDSYTAPVAYSFDEDPNTMMEVPLCVAPRGYIYDQQRDDVRYDTQGYIFTDIPDSTIDPAYQPIVAEVTVTTNGLPCQATKEDTDLVKRKDVTFADGLLQAQFPDEPGAHPFGKPTGRILARPVIDPSLDVRQPAGYNGPTDPGGGVDPNTLLGPQRWGWYGRFLLAWLDGGVIPTKQSTVTDMAGNTQTITTMQFQNVYFPTSHPVTDASGNVTVDTNGALGDGFDVLTLRRGEAGYSPLCEVISFDPADPMNPETTVKAITMNGSMVDTMTLVWCIQVTQ